MSCFLHQWACVSRMPLMPHSRLHVDRRLELFCIRRLMALSLSRSMRRSLLANTDRRSPRAVAERSELRQSCQASGGRYGRSLINQIRALTSLEGLRLHRWPPRFVKLR
jgi:hypothetical protein